MKIRQGFVSNSSTSSFCVFGIELDNGPALLKKLIKAGEIEPDKGCEHEFDRKTVKFCEECGEAAYVDPEENFESYDLEEYFNNKALDVVNGEGDEIYIGINLENENVNLKILTKAEELLKELYPKKKAQFYSGTRYC
jgi:hypothetical protein